ncbi:MAG TPA: GAF domain-containing sensor histidine kinase [Gemmatimonadaceae bacterium]
MKKRGAATRPERVTKRPRAHPAVETASGLDASLLAQLQRAFVSAPVALAVTEGATHKLRYANAPFARLQSSGEIAITPASSSDSPDAVELAPLLDRAFRQIEVVRDRVVGPGTRWSCTAWPIGNEGDVPKGLVVEVRDATFVEGIRARQSVIAERLLLGALREQDAATAARATGKRATLLASVSHDLAVSLDQDATRDVVRHVRLEREGAWCIVDLLEPNGMIHRLAVVHPDPAKQELARELTDRWYEVEPDDPVHLANTAQLAHLQPIVLGKDADEALAAVARGPHELETLRALGFENLVIVPLVVQARVLGTLTFVTTEGDAPLSMEDVALASDLADRCALALDHARLYREAEVLRTAADAASRAKSDFLRRITHDFRTPLAAISGFVDLLLLGSRGELTDEQRTDLNRIKHNQQHLTALITQVLDYARNEGGGIEYHYGALPLQSMLTEVAGMLDQAGADKDVKLELRRTDPNAVAWADADRTRQILLNLLSNAVKFSPKGTTITVDCSATTDWVMVHVTDAGPGIPADKLDEIFHPFVRLDHGVLVQQGLGLGLAISRDLARAMHGDVTVASTVGVGSRFTLILPHAA